MKKTLAIILSLAIFLLPMTAVVASSEAAATSFARTVWSDSMENAAAGVQENDGAVAERFTEGDRAGMLIRSGGGTAKPNVYYTMPSDFSFDKTVLTFDFKVSEPTDVENSTNEVFLIELGKKAMEPRPGATTPSSWHFVGGSPIMNKAEQKFGEYSIVYGTWYTAKYILDFENQKYTIGVIDSNGDYNIVKTETALPYATFDRLGKISFGCGNLNSLYIDNVAVSCFDESEITIACDNIVSVNDSGEINSNVIIPTGFTAARFFVNGIKTDDIAPVSGISSYKVQTVLPAAANAKIGELCTFRIEADYVEGGTLSDTKEVILQRSLDSAVYYEQNFDGSLVSPYQYLISSNDGNTESQTAVGLGGGYAHEFAFANKPQSQVQLEAKYFELPGGLPKGIYDTSFDFITTSSQACVDIMARKGLAEEVGAGGNYIAPNRIPILKNGKIGETTFSVNEWHSAKIRFNLIDMEYEIYYSNTPSGAYTICASGDLTSMNAYFAFRALIGCADGKEFKWDNLKVTGQKAFPRATETSYELNGNITAVLDGDIANTAGNIRLEKADGTPVSVETVSYANKVITVAPDEMLLAGDYKLVIENDVTAYSTPFIADYAIPFTVSVEDGEIYVISPAADSTYAGKVTLSAYAPGAEKVKFYINEKLVHAFDERSADGIYSYELAESEINCYDNSFDIYAVGADNFTSKNIQFFHSAELKANDAYKCNFDDQIGAITARNALLNAGATVAGFGGSGNAMLYTHKDTTDGFFQPNITAAYKGRVVYSADVKTLTNTDPIAMEIGINTGGAAAIDGNYKTLGGAIGNVPALFGADGTIAGTSTRYKPDTWMNMKYVIDLNNAKTELYIDGKFIASSNITTVLTENTVVYSKLRLVLNNSTAKSEGEDGVGITIDNMAVYEGASIPNATAATYSTDGVTNVKISANNIIPVNSQRINVELSKAYDVASLEGKVSIVNDDGEQVPATVVSADGKNFSITFDTPLGKVGNVIYLTFGTGASIQSLALMSPVKIPFIVGSEDMIYVSQPITETIGEFDISGCKYISESDATASCMFILAEYDVNGNMTNAVLNNSEFVKGSATVFAKKSAGSGTRRTFVWNNELKNYR